MTPNGCYNRAPLATHVVVQDGWQKVEASAENPWGRTWIEVRVRRDIMIEDPMTKDCQYSLTAKDPRCEGCIRNRGVPIADAL